MDMKSVCTALTVAAGLALPSSATALTITSIEGVWQNANHVTSGEGEDQIRWGVPDGQGQSGYNFDAAGTDLVADPDENFVLGTFTHLNFPVYGPFLEMVDLVISFTVEGVSEAITSVFSFAHNETLNSSSTCANGQGNGVGVNANGCADHVTAVLNEARTETFVIDDVEYVMDITGFEFEGETMSDFWTVESAENASQLSAIFRTLDDENQPPPPEVPLPASGLLLLGGLAALAARRRRS